LHQWIYVVIFGVFILFCFWWPYFVICAICRTIRACGCLLLLFMDIFGCLWLDVRTLSEYFGTGPLWTWVRNDDWFNPSFVGILTRVKTIEVCIESVFTTVCVQSAIAGCFLSLWWGRLDWVALYQVPWSKKLNKKLKVVILPLSETKSESFTILFYDNPLNSTHSCIQMAVTAVVVTENVCMNMRWKDELVGYGIRK
jgi:hypothetical protein